MKHLYHCPEEFGFRKEKVEPFVCFPLGNILAIGKESIVLFGMGAVYPVMKKEDGYYWYIHDEHLYRKEVKRLIADVKEKLEAYHSNNQ